MPISYSDLFAACGYLAIEKHRGKPISQIDQFPIFLQFAIHEFMHWLDNPRELIYNLKRRNRYSALTKMILGNMSHGCLPCFGYSYERLYIVSKLMENKLGTEVVDWYYLENMLIEPTCSVIPIHNL